MTPLGSNVLLELQAAATVSAGGIHLPDQVKKAPTKGTVLSIGPLVTEVTLGDVVVFPQFAATQIELEGIEVVLVTQGMIQAKL